MFTADACTFEETGGVSTVYRYTVSEFKGSNCGDSQDDSEIKFTVSSEESSSFTTGVSGGVGVNGGEEVPVGISVKVEAEYTTGQSFGQSEELSYKIPTNKQSALIIQQPYDRHSGRLRVNYGSKVDDHFIW